CDTASGSASSRSAAMRSGGASEASPPRGRARSATTSTTGRWRSCMRRPLDLRLGIDVGGTNTDAVVLDHAGSLLAKAKVATTPDVTSGIVAALDHVLAATGESRSRISHVMFGTT